MPRQPEHPQESQERRENMLAHQRSLLQFIPQWLRYRGLKQRHLAEHMGVTEGQVSKWLRGVDQMRVGGLSDMAVLLKADPSDIIGEPPGNKLGKPLADLLAAADGLDAASLEQLAAMAKLLKDKRTA